QCATEVAGTAREVQHHRAARQSELSNGAAPPADLHPERHHAIHEVIPTRDPVEEPADRPRLLVTLGEADVRGQASPPPSRPPAVSSRTRRKCEDTSRSTAGSNSRNASTS